MKNNLKRIRTIKKMSQKDLADSLGVSKQVISMWENNPNEKIPENRLKQIADFLQVDEEEIFSDEINENKIKAKSLQQQIQDLYIQLRTTSDEDEKESLHREIQLLDNIESITEVEKRIQVELEMMSLEEISHNTGRFNRVEQFCRILNEFTGGFSNLTSLKRILDQFEEGNNKKLTIMNVLIDYLESLNEHCEYVEDPFVWVDGGIVGGDFYHELNELIKKYKLI